ncbi:MAG: FlgD immunoglobulin-like domain containing protein [Candidatus Cloacimonas sp.]|jgi:hypothetical protein|nr:T9SS type A sorting domain-containing protein [Candidatus Cloacimonadota bacterium]
MKRYLILTCIILSVATLMFADLMVPTNLMKEAKADLEYVLPNKTGNNAREDNYSFNVPPMTLLNTFYDYFPGGYESIPIRVQPSPVGGFEGGGVYIAFQATPISGGVRKVYYTYILDGQLLNPPALPDLTGTNAQGFPGIDIDWVTGDPFLSWHTPSPGNADVFHCPFNFDQYSMIGTPGLWNEAYGVINNPYTVNGEAGQEFIWPSVFVGPSPTEGMRRVYVVGKNQAQNAFDHPCENSLIAFADFSDSGDLAFYDESMWTYVTVPQMDQWRNEDIRPFRSTIVSKKTGNIAVVGHTSNLAEGSGAFDPNSFLFVIENDNYGEGEWTMWTADPTIKVENPNDYFFDDEANAPYKDMRYGPYVNRHNATVDDQGSYHFLANYTLSTEGNTWYPNLTTVKHVKFDRRYDKFVVNDVYPQKPGERYVPWDYDENGEVITNEEGNVLANSSFPYYYWDADAVFHENYYRIISDGPFMVALFQESLMSRFFNEFNAEDFAEWASVPETYLYVSRDYGRSWSEDPIILNSIDTPELAGTVPVYWYMADNIEMLDDDWGRIHLLFLDDNDYGSYIQENSPINSGGTLMYTSLDLNFSIARDSAEEVAIAPTKMSLSQNYPNPFNPETTISFAIDQPMNVSLEVYNVKGQLIKTLFDGSKASGEHRVVWNGRDNSNNEVASGLYFYKLSTEKHTEMKKMLLVK